MEPVFKVPASPGTPLFPVSPERANRQPIPQSPSLPSNLEDPFISNHTRVPSDVQGKVAQFNNLSKETAQRRRDNEAALKRAVLGREEAEGETRRLKEEHRVLRKEIEEGRGRERRVGERLEALMEELQRTKETHAHSQTLYEKEVRRARKEAFKSSSALVKLQEELKTARNKFTLMREEAEAQRRKVETREQETFAAQYQSAGLQEELEIIKRQLKTTEDERDAAKNGWKEEEAARIAAEGRIPLPASPEKDGLSSPKKISVRKSRESLKENLDPLDLMDLMEPEETEEDELRADLAWERKLRRRLEGQVHFMLMECQFKRCSCRIAEEKGVDFVHDGRFNEAIAAKKAALEASKAKRALEHNTVDTENMDPEAPQIDSPTSKPETIQASPAQSPPSPRQSVPTDNDPPAQADPDPEPEQPSDTLVRFSPTSGTFSTVQAPIPPSPSVEASPNNLIPQTPTALLRFSPQLPLVVPLNNEHQTSSSEESSHDPTTPRPLLPVPPTMNSTFMSRTTTTTVPLAAIPPSPFTPNPTMSREEALEQIRQRRGRARSIAAGHGTPRKQMIDLSSLRRDISAPAGR
ncbi:MAG: hypothetical protein Q9191_004797 [Dirinaria sp. TL-2023a]